jgi:glycosyltransferase involved in cell wall biosynthesis
LRPSYLSKYLRDFGWDVTVLTRRLNGESSRDVGGAQVVTAPVLGDRLEDSVRAAFDANGGASKARPNTRLRSALRWAKKTLSFPDRAVGWTPAAVALGCRLARTQRFDAVMSTAMPATTHLVGAAIALRSGLPWIADYRDPWTGNPGAKDGPMRAWLHRRVERFVLRRAVAITTISEAIASRLEAIHNTQVTVIPNARDTSEWDGLDSIQPTEFALCYTGAMYAERSPSLLFEALAVLRAQGDPAGNARVVLFGPCDAHVKESAQKYGVTDLVEQHGVVSRAEALAAQRRASDLLVFLNLDPSSLFELGSKVIEYAQARRPIIAFGPPGSVMEQHLARNSLGWFASNLDEAITALRQAHRRYAAGDLELPAPEQSFGARDLAGAFANRLDAVI